MKNYKFEFDCDNAKGQNLVASFPVGVVTIEKSTLEDACKWFVEYLYPMFDRLAGDNTPWRLELVSAHEDKQDVSLQAIELIAKIEEVN